MANNVMNAQSAAGTNWVNPNNALANDSNKSRFPGGGTNHLLVLSNFTNRNIGPTREIVGFEIRVDALAESVSGQMGLASRTYSGNIGDMVELAPDVWDDSLSTYYGDAVSGLFVSLTVIHDLGSPQTVGYIRSTWMHGADMNSAQYAYSNNGTSWTAVPRGVVVIPAPGGSHTDDFALTSTVSARYWRITMADSSMVRLHNFRLYVSSVGAEILPGGGGAPQRIECAVSVDGSTALSAWQPLTLSDTEQSFTVGGPTNLLGIGSILSSQVNNSNFSILIRRADGLSGEDTSTWREVEFVEVTCYHNFLGGSLMPARISGNQLNIFAPESVKGTAATPTKRWKSINFIPQFAPETEELRQQGDFGAADHIETFNSGELQLAGYPTYDELPWCFQFGAGKLQSQLVETGVYRHTVNVIGRGLKDPATATVEWGDENVAERIIYGLITDLSIGASKKQNRLSGRMMGRRLSEQAAITPGVNQAMTLAITGTPSGGNFRLMWEGQETADITYNAAAGAIQSALTSIGILTGNVTVSGSSPTYTLTFGGSLAGKSLPVIEVSKKAFTGGTTPNATCVIATLGGYSEAKCVPIEPSQWSVYHHTGVDSLLANKLDNLYDMEWGLSGLYEPVSKMDAATGNTWSTHADKPFNCSGQILVQADQAAQVLSAAVNSRTRRFLMFEAVGPEIVPGQNFRIRITMACRVKEKQGLENAGEIWARRFAFESNFDDSWGQMAKIEFINATPSYT